MIYICDKCINPLICKCRPVLQKLVVFLHGFCYNIRVFDLLLSVSTSCLSLTNNLLVSTFRSASQKAARDDICSSRCYNTCCRYVFCVSRHLSQGKYELNTWKPAGLVSVLHSPALRHLRVYNQSGGGIRSET